MRINYYIKSHGILSRKENTLYFIKKLEGDEIKKIPIPIEKVSLKYQNEQQLGFQYVGHGYKKLQRGPSIPNIIQYISKETNLTYKTIVKILSKINNIHIIFNDPQTYISQIVSIINEKLADLRVNKIKYIEQMNILHLISLTICQLTLIM